MNQKKILVVDDSQFDRNLLVKALAQKADFECIEASSGERCLELLASEPVGLILMDIMMPGQFGTQVLIDIRKKFNLIELPIIMVTSKADASDVVGCLQSGANDYITKPVNFEVAVSRISTHLKLAEISGEMSKLREMVALDAMITTYNHEINNPLMIALGCLNDSLLKDEAAVEKLKSSLWRVADIVKKIREVTQKKEIEYRNYGDLSKMVKV
jgi:DNA-binding response OmpR family regulator